MSLPSKSHLARNIVVLAVVTVIAVSAAGYVLLRGFNFGLNQSLQEVTISGNDLKETVPVSTNSSISLTCNYCNITFSLNSNVMIKLDVIGNYNTASVNGGYTNLDVTGNYNTVNAQNTVLVSNSNTGTGNTVNQ